ncbi:hypothetical protein AB6813_02720 [bacterium RCC_150]
MGWLRALKVLVTPLAMGAVVLLFVSLALASCEYTYGDGRALASSSPSASRPGPLPSRYLARDRTVTGDALRVWALAALPDPAGLSYYSNYGLLAAGETRTGTTAPLPDGSYTLTFACRDAA